MKYRLFIGFFALTALCSCNVEQVFEPPAITSFDYHWGTLAIYDYGEVLIDRVPKRVTGYARKVKTADGNRGSAYLEITYESDTILYEATSIDDLPYGSIGQQFAFNKDDTICVESAVEALPFLCFDCMHGCFTYAGGKGFMQFIP